MSRKRDRASASGLLPLMEARPWRDGRTITYRYHPIGKKPINLGTDRLEAIRRVLDLNGQAKGQGSIQSLWKVYPPRLAVTVRDRQIHSLPRTRQVHW